MTPVRLIAVSALALALAIAPVRAQDTAEPRLSEQLEEAFRGLMDRMQPALDELQDTLEVFDKIDSLKNYARPEILPNGDIIIRRRPDAPPYEGGGDVRT